MTPEQLLQNIANNNVNISTDILAAFITKATLTLAERSKRAQLR